MSDLATTTPGRPPAAALLDKKMKKSHAMISGAVVIAALVIGLGFIAVHLGHSRQLLALSAACCGPADRARLRVCERLPRHGKCSRHSHLHPFARPEHRRGLVGLCATWQACSRPPAPWLSPSSRCFPSNSSCRSVRAPVSPWSSRCSSPPSVEPEHLVVRPARLQFPHHGRLHHRRRLANQLMNGQRHLRRGLGTGYKGLQGPAHLAGCRDSL
jgi:hypothetical protein